MGLRFQVQVSGNGNAKEGLISGTALLKEGNLKFCLALASGLHAQAKVRTRRNEISPAYGLREIYINAARNRPRDTRL